MKKLVLIIFFFKLLFISEAQLNKEVWLIDGKRMLDTNFPKYKLGFTFDARNTFVANTKAKLGGIKLGLYINRVHQVGIGLYAMNKPLYVSQIPDNSLVVYSVKVDFSYLSLFYERILFFDRHWEWSSTVHYGAGEINASYMPEKDTQEISLPEIKTKPLEISTSVLYHPTYWLSIGGGIGYRIMRKTPKQYHSYFNGGIYLVKVKIRLFKLIRSIGNKEVKNEY